MITMQAFLDDYKNGQALGSSLDSFISKNPNHQLALAMKKIHLAFADIKKFDAAIAAVNLVDYKQYAIEEQLIFLQWLCHLYIKANRIASANSILSTIKRLSSNDLLPEWQIIPIDAEGDFYDTEGKFLKKIEVYEKCMKILGPNSGRYQVLMAAYLNYLSFMNEHEKFEKTFLLYKTIIKDTVFINFEDYLALNRGLETGNFRDFPSLIAKIKEDKALIFCLNDVAVCQKIYQIFIENNISFLDEQNPEDWIYLSCANLVKNNPEKALVFAHKYAENHLDSKMAPSFVNYFLIRAELANKNTNTAEYYLENRKKSTNSSMYDDYFWFRIFHIKGETNKAQQYFNLFFANVEKYKLDNRFNIELRLSPEISLTDIRNYSRNIDKPVLALRTQKPLNKLQEDTLIDFIIGESDGIKQVKTLIKKFAEIDTTVLIVGETGTGKELVAKALWQMGRYKEYPYIPINCGAISDHLLQSELFGHKKGAFTGAYQDHKGVFEEAGNGIVFLDEIGEISPAMQINLLRILEAREFRAVGSNENKKLICKIIAATNRNLAEHVKSGNFRQDLQYRLERLTIEIPPLRERSSDIPILINHFLNVENPQLPPIFFDEPALQYLMALPWHGNIRELRNEMERIRLFYSDKKILTIAELSNKYQIKKSTILPDKTPVSIPTPTVVLKHEPSEINESLLNLNSKFRRLEELKNSFVKHAKLSRIEVEDLLKVSPNTAVTYLNILEKENYICKKTFASSKTHYYEIIR